MTSNPPGYKAQRAKRRNAAGLCRDCPNRLGVYKGRCDECMDKHRREQHRRLGLFPWVKGNPGRPRKDGKSDG